MRIRHRHITYLPNLLLNFIFPNSCLVCGRFLKYDLTNKLKQSSICASCIDELTYAEDSKSILTNLLDFFGYENLYLDSVSSMIDIKRDKGYMKAIYELKYFGNRKVGYDLGRILGNKLQSELSLGQYQAIQALPLHKAKERERTYNQSLYIAKGISEVANLPIIDCAKRTINTTTQTQLSANDRQKNVKDIFIMKKRLKHESILLVDDVLTTGATVNSLAKVFKENGAKTIGVATIVKA